MDPGAVFRYQCDAAFPLSDHADFADLLRFVELVQPKRVYTVHGSTEEFARTLRERGIEAWALGQDNQLEISLAELNRGPLKAKPVVVMEKQAAAPNDLLAFANVGEKIRATMGKLEKVDLLKKLFPHAQGRGIAGGGGGFHGGRSRRVNRGR